MESVRMSPMELAKTEMAVNNANKSLGGKKTGRETGLGKDSFLKLLVTELKHQDPTRPMEDKQFIAQMAQFSSLEQMTNLNKEIQSLIKSSQSSEAFGLIGKTVDAFDPITKKMISGVVDSIQFNGGQMGIMVGKSELAMDNISKVYNTDSKINKQNIRISNTDAKHKD